MDVFVCFFALPHNWDNWCSNRLWIAISSCGEAWFCWLDGKDDRDGLNSPYMLSTLSIASFNVSPDSSCVAISGISILELSDPWGRMYPWDQPHCSKWHVEWARTCALIRGVQWCCHDKGLCQCVMLHSTAKSQTRLTQWSQARHQQRMKIETWKMNQGGQRWSDYDIGPWGGLSLYQL